MQQDYRKEHEVAGQNPRPEVTNGAAGRFNGGTMGSESMGHCSQQTYRPGPIPDSVDPFSRNSFLTDGCACQRPGDRTNGIGIAPAVQSGFDRPAKIAVMPEPCVYRYRHGLVHVAADAVAKVQGQGQIAYRQTLVQGPVHAGDQGLPFLVGGRNFP